MFCEIYSMKPLQHWFLYEAKIKTLSIFPYVMAHSGGVCELLLLMNLQNNDAWILDLANVW
jgi:uncharacterized protein YcgL (UPF0745 family)